jgi:hypothetical protein
LFNAITANDFLAMADVAVRGTDIKDIDGIPTRYLISKAVMHISPQAGPYIAHVISK